MEKKRKRAIGNVNWELPGDITEVILSKLPFFNLPSCRLVCKAWNDVVLSCKFDASISIGNLLFAHISPYHSLHCVDFDPKHKHLEGIRSVASFNFHPDLEGISIINSCRGLLCFLIMKKTKTTTKFFTLTPLDVCILNPITNQSIKIPIPPKSNTYYGLGFCPKTKQYKLVRNSLLPCKSATLVEILSFGTTFNSSNPNSHWTPVAFLPFSIENHGLYFDGGLYFVGVHIGLDDEIVIYRLDMEHEKIQQISSPRRSGDSCFIGVFNDTLYLTLWVDWHEYHVWKMEQHSNSSSSSSWIKAFSVCIPRHVYYPQHPRQPTGSFHLQLIKACEDGKILCLDAGLLLLLYDPNSQTTQVLTDQDDPDIEKHMCDIKKHMWVYQIDTFHFNSLNNILAGDT